MSAAPAPSPQDADRTSQGRTAQDIVAERLSQFMTELQRKLATEISNLQVTFQQELEKEVQKAVAEMKMREEEAAAELLEKEAEFEAMNRGTMEMIQDPDIEIAKIIQRNVKQSELQAYIKGLRFSLNKNVKPETIR